MTKLNLITTTFNGTEIRAVNHPEKGMVLMAVDALRAAGYKIGKAGAHPLLKYAGVAETERVHLLGSTLVDHLGAPLRFGSATFLTRAGVHQLLMASTKPAAKEFREWLAGEVVVAIQDTGGYLLNEAARETARADNRSTVPLPEDLRGAYAALIAEKRARIAAEHDALKALEAAATEADERRRITVKLMEKEAENERMRGQMERMGDKAEIGARVSQHLHKVGHVAGTLPGLNRLMIKKDLERLGYLYAKGGAYRVYSQFRDKLFKEDFNEQYGTMDIRVHPEGRALILKHYSAGELTMKKGCAVQPVVA